MPQTALVTTAEAWVTTSARRDPLRDRPLPVTGLFAPNAAGETPRERRTCILERPASTVAMGNNVDGGPG